MNRSSRISHWQLATIGLVCCISGIRILLSVGNRVLLQEEKVPERSQLQPQELLDRSLPKGDQNVHGLKIKNVKDNKISELKLDGLFVAIGHDPATSLFKNQLKMDKEGYLITKPDSTQTNIPGVFAAGDVKDKIFRQAVTAAGMGCMAALEAEKHLSHK